jgi:hypothetical protein
MGPGPTTRPSSQRLPADDLARPGSHRPNLRFRRRGAGFRPLRRRAGRWRATPSRPARGVAIAATEDGATGLAYFQRADCQAGGWLVAGRPTAAWQERVVGLRLLPSPDACPTALDLSLTRWRVLRTELPFLREGQAGGVFSAPTLISDTTATRASRPPTIWSAFGWRAAWVGALGTLGDERSAWRGAQPVASGRCPDVAGGDPPGPGWIGWTAALDQLRALARQAGVLASRNIGGLAVRRPCHPDLVPEARLHALMQACCAWPRPAPCASLPMARSSGSATSRISTPSPAACPASRAAMAFGTRATAAPWPSRA